jgi:hypothetical protein
VLGRDIDLAARPPVADRPQCGKDDVTHRALEALRGKRVVEDVLDGGNVELARRNAERVNQVCGGIRFAGVLPGRTIRRRRPVDLAAEGREVGRVTCGDDPFCRLARPPPVAVDQAPHRQQPSDRFVVVEPIPGCRPARAHDAVAPFPRADRRDIEAGADGCLLDRVHGLVRIPRRQHLTNIRHWRYGSATPRWHKA